MKLELLALVRNVVLLAALMSSNSAWARMNDISKNALTAATSKVTATALRNQAPTVHSTGRDNSFINEDETEGSDTDLRSQGMIVEDEEQARKQAPDRIKKFKAPFNAWGASGSLPELLTIDYFRMFNSHWGLHVSVSPPIPYTLHVQQETQTESVYKGLQIATPAASFPLHLTYGPYAGADMLFFPIAESSFFMSGGLGYRRLSLTGKIRSPLYICFVNVETPCDDSVAFNSNPSYLNTQLNYQSTSLLWRAAFGWFKPLNRRQYLSIVAFGLTKAIRTFRSSKIDYELDPELATVLDNVKAGSTPDGLLSRRNEALENKTANQAAIIENVALPIVSVGTGWLF